MADAQVYTIHGWVSAPAKKAVGSFEVFLTIRDGSEIIAHTEASKSGDFVLNNLQGGSYDIVINLPGFRDSTTHAQLGPMGSTSIPRGPESPFWNVFIVLIPDNRSRRQVEEQDAYTQSIVKEYAKGLEELDNNHPDLAVIHLEQVVRQVPDYSDAHLNLGFAYQNLSLKRQAEAEFRKAQSLKPDSARPLVALGRLFVDEADIEIRSGAKPEVIQLKLAQAREALTEGISSDEKLASGFYYLGAVDFYSANYTDAEKELKHALELDEEHYAARIMLINVYFRQNQLNAALDNLDEFLLGDPPLIYRQQAETVRAIVVRRLQAMQSSPIALPALRKPN
jgi:Tfp pilus assembly protein PilF